MGRAARGNLASPIWSAFAAGMLAMAVMLSVCSIGHSQQIVALVNGEPITNLDVEHRTKLIQMSTNKTPTRKEVLDDIIDEVLEIKEAKKFSIDISNSDVDNAFANVAKRVSMDPPKFAQLLANSGASADTLKHRLKAELAWTSLVRGRYKASLEIRDSDIEAALELHKSDDKSEKNNVGYEYIMRPIIMILPRGSAEAAIEVRKRDAEALRARFQSCSDGIQFARALREVAVRDQVSKFSADLPQQLRDILDNTPEGHLTPPEVTAEGVQMFALCTKRETKTDTPEKRQIRETMFQQKFGAKAKRYLESLRRAAMIEYK